MAEFRIDLGRQTSFELIDLFRDRSESFGVAIRIAAAFVVGDDGEAFTQGGGELCQHCVHRKSLKPERLWRKRPL